jgi:hypothetical protein
MPSTLRKPAALALKSILLFIMGCSRGCPIMPGTPHLGIDVKKDNNGVVFSFSNCLHDAILDVKLITVFFEDVAICEIERTNPQVPGIIGSWRYASVPTGFVKRGCSPLLPGHRYKIEASGAAIGVVTFSLTREGSVALESAPCK